MLTNHGRRKESPHLATARQSRTPTISIDHPPTYVPTSLPSIKPALPSIHSPRRLYRMCVHKNTTIPHTNATPNIYHLYMYLLTYHYTDIHLWVPPIKCSGPTFTSPHVLSSNKGVHHHNHVRANSREKEERASDYYSMWWPRVLPSSSTSPVFDHWLAWVGLIVCWCLAILRCYRSCCWRRTTGRERERGHYDLSNMEGVSTSCKDGILENLEKMSKKKAHSTTAVVVRVCVCVRVYGWWCPVVCCCLVMMSDVCM